MDPKDFKRWRKSLGLSQKQAAEALGLKRRMVQYYEKGERDGEKVAVPRPVRLACYALAAGITDYHGPGSDGAAAPAAGKKGKKAGKKAPMALADEARQTADMDIEADRKVTA